MTAFLGAMAGEISGIEARMEVLSEQRWGRIAVRIGLLDDLPILCARTGVGKAMAAASTTHILERYAPDAVVYLGIAGALDPGLEIGDMVIATESIQHDLDATMFGFARGEVPYDGIREIASDERLLEIAREYGPAEGKIVSGRILTGDAFCSAATRRERGYLTDELGGSAVDMEGAAAALAAHLAGIPFLHARIISDRADGCVPADFSRFLPLAAERIADFVDFLVGPISRIS